MLGEGPAQISCLFFDTRPEQALPKMIDFRNFMMMDVFSWIMHVYHKFVHRHKLSQLSLRFVGIVILNNFL